MILKKISAGLFLLFFLNGCVQSTALLGPAYTLASTGNIYQAGLSYGSNQAVKKITGKSPTENIKSLTDSKKSKIDEEQNYDEFFALVKNRIEKTSKIINSANQ
jgi:phosphoribosylaminoimidazole (AIR) synthetase